MRNPSILLVATALLGAGAAVADPVSVTFTGVNGRTGFGYYLSPYNGTVNGDLVTLYCNDFANEVHIGQSWQANITPLAGGDLSNTRYGALSNALTLYTQAAWLTTQFESSPEESADIQATIWRLFVPAAPLPSSNKWFLEASEHYSQIDPKLFKILTNVGVRPTGQVQEFIFDPPVAVPEASPSLLLVTIALSLVFFLSKRASA